jgi:hypothetical protein
MYMHKNWQNFLTSVSRSIKYVFTVLSHTLWDCVMIANVLRMCLLYDVNCYYV